MIDESSGAFTVFQAQNIVNQSSFFIINPEYFYVSRSDASLTLDYDRGGCVCLTVFLSLSLPVVVSFQVRRRHISTE